jgi:hypothetical protein
MAQDYNRNVTLLKSPEGLSSRAQRGTLVFSAYWHWMFSSKKGNPQPLMPGEAPGYRFPIGMTLSLGAFMLADIAQHEIRT